MKMKLCAGGILAMLLFGSSQVVFGQDPYAFNFTEEKGDNTGEVLTTATTTNIAIASTALGFTTSYEIEFTINNGILNINRQNISPLGPNAAAAYYGGPVAVPLGSTVDFGTWLNQSAQSGSSESIYNLSVNNVPLSQTITANSGNTAALYQYTSSTPITDIKFDYLINAVAGATETGFGVNIIAPSAVPEPTSVVLLTSSIVSFLFLKRKR